MKIRRPFKRNDAAKKATYRIFGSETSALTQCHLSPFNIENISKSTDIRQKYLNSFKKDDALVNPQTLMQQQNSVRISYDTTEFQNLDQVKRTLLTKEKVDKNDDLLLQQIWKNYDTKKSLDGNKKAFLAFTHINGDEEWFKKTFKTHSALYRSKTSNRAISSIATFFASGSGVKFKKPYEAAVTTVCGINLSGSSVIDEKKFNWNQEAYQAQMKKVFLLALSEQNKLGVEVSVLPFIGAGVYLNKVDPKYRDEAKKTILTAFVDAVTLLKKNGTLNHIEEIILSVPNTDELETSETFKLAEKVLTERNIQGLPTISLVNADMYALGHELSQTKKVGIINAGSDRTVGGNYKDPTATTQEECTWSLSNVCFSQDFDHNPRLQKNKFYHAYTADKFEEKKEKKSSQFTALKHPMPLNKERWSASLFRQNKFKDPEREKKDELLLKLTSYTDRIRNSGSWPGEELEDFKRVKFRSPIAEDSQAINRKATFKMVVELKQLLANKNNPQSIEAIFDKNNMEAVRKKHGATRGIHSKEVNKIIKDVDNYLKNATKKKSRRNYKSIT